VIYDHASSVSILGWFFEVLALAALVCEGFAFVDALRRPAQAFIAVSKQTKPRWLIITGVATVVGLAAAGYDTGPLGWSGTLAIAAFVASAVYLTDVRPKVKDYRVGKTGTRMGPYGPW
jgi:hypothetical protein